MADRAARKKSAMLQRMRKNLERRREALVHQFDFKLYIVFRFKDKTKKTAIYEVDDPELQMTVDHQHSILQGVRNTSYTYSSSKELMNRDIAQFHAKAWQSTRQDDKGRKTPVDFLLWPRNDVEGVTAYLFSRWKGELEEPFRPLDIDYNFPCSEYEEFLRYEEQEDKTHLVATNVEETLFLFLNRRQMTTDKNRMTVFSVSGFCVYCPQDRLTMWKAGTEADVVAGVLI